MSITSINQIIFTLATNTTPASVGPGSYNLDIKNLPPETVFPFNSTTRRELWDTPDFPNVGPGSHNSIKSSRSRFSTISRNQHNRDYFIDQAQSPSPADHAPLNDWSKNAKQKCRSETCMRNRPPRYQKEPPIAQQKVATPGPADYNTNTDGIIRGVSAFSKSKVPQREPLKDNGIPGPGQYGTIETKIPNRQSPVFKSRRRGNLFKAPDYEGVMLDHQAWTTEDDNQRRPFGSNSKRELQFRILDTPSPDSYETYGLTARNASKNDILSNTTSSVYRQKKNRGIKQRKGTFGTDRDTYNESANDNPGPGYYGEIKPMVTKTRPSSANKAKLNNLWISDFITPSAPDYDVTRTGFEEKKIKMRTPTPQFKGEPVLRDCLTNREPNPGPAFYVKVDNTRKTTIPKRTRFRDDEYMSGIKISSNPSPAEYSISGKNEKNVHGGFIPKNTQYEKKIE